MNTQDLLKALISRVSGGMVHIHIDEIMTAHQHHLAMIIQDNGYVQCKLQDGPEQPEWPDETRIDIIGSNGNDGEHYAQG